MRYRAAEQQDLLRLAAIGAQAFANDAVYAHIYPFRHFYPEDYYEGILMTLRKAFATPGCLILVIELDGADLPNTPDLVDFMIVGYMVFNCHGTTEQKNNWSVDSEEKRLQRKLLEIEETSRSNRAMDVDKEAILPFYEEGRRSLGSLSNAVEGSALAIVPECQRAGLGKRAFLHMRQLIHEKGMDMVFDSSMVGLPLYLKLGAQIVGHARLPARLVKRETLEVSLPEITIPIMRSQVRHKAFL